MSRAGSRTVDTLAALITGLERPTAYYVDELLLAWRHAQQEATDAYARWHELAPRDGHAVYLAALDREERAAGVYAEVRRRALERVPDDMERPGRGSGRDGPGHGDGGEIVQSG